MSKTVIVNVSARHIHVSKEDLEVLFGKGYELSVRKMLLQPGQFATNERVDIVGPKGTIKGVSVLGPIRNATQVEVSLTDARALGINPPIRESGDIANSAGCKIVGPVGEVDLKEGVIIAKRHIHCTPEDAERYNLKNSQIVEVKVVTPERSLTFGDVIVRVSDKYALEMHIDTDESNAAGIVGSAQGEILS